MTSARTAPLYRDGVGTRRPFRQNNIRTPKVFTLISYVRNREYFTNRAYIPRREKTGIGLLIKIPNASLKIVQSNTIL